MKLAVSGKGGVGKTTISAMLCLGLREEGYRVLAVDADPVANLGAALGFPEANKLKPISEMKELIAERTGAKPGSFGGYFKLNPRVDDIPEKFCQEKDGIRLIVMGTIKTGGSGCVCPESALLKALLQYLILERDEAVVIDMEAGVEHLGRATAGSVNWLIVVIEPGQRSVNAARMIRDLARDIGLAQIGIIANKVREESDLEILKKSIPDFQLLGWFPHEQKIIENDLGGKPVPPDLPVFQNQVKNIISRLRKT